MLYRAVRQTIPIRPKSDCPARFSMNLVPASNGSFRPGAAIVKQEFTKDAARAPDSRAQVGNSIPAKRPLSGMRTTWANDGKWVEC